MGILCGFCRCILVVGMGCGCWVWVLVVGLCRRYCWWTWLRLLVRCEDGLVRDGWDEIVGMRVTLYGWPKDLVGMWVVG